MLSGATLVFSLKFAADLAETWGDLVIFGVIAIASTLVLIGLPVAGALLPLVSCRRDSRLRSRTPYA
jgi:hypothetical protein